MIYKELYCSGASHVPLMVKNPPANAGDIRDAGSILGWEDPLEKQRATHSNILAWKMLWTEELDTTEHFYVKGRVCHHLHFQPFSLLKGTHTHTHTCIQTYLCVHEKKFLEKFLRNICLSEGGHEIWDRRTYFSTYMLVLFVIFNMHTYYFFQKSVSQF